MTSAGKVYVYTESKDELNIIHPQDTLKELVLPEGVKATKIWCSNRVMGKDPSDSRRDIEPYAVIIVLSEGGQAFIIKSCYLRAQSNLNYANPPFGEGKSALMSLPNGQTLFAPPKLQFGKPSFQKELPPLRPEIRGL